MMINIHSVYDRREVLAFCTMHDRARRPLPDPDDAGYCIDAVNPASGGARRIDPTTCEPFFTSDTRRE
jgi:hypothetical protein